MCGIAGLVELSGGGVDRRILLRMLARIAHRGPDGGGWLEDDGREICEGDRASPEPRFVRPLGPRRSATPRAALGHQRLAITDLSEAGRQPMSRGEGRWWIVFNGAIYNALELRKELEGLGESFSTSTDTEVLLAAFIRWGEGALSRFNGMWAFAIWDSKERELFCARDRFGIKPFFYTVVAELFAFASEPKALRPIRQAEPDVALVGRYLRSGGTAGGGGETCYSTYRALPEGSVLRANASGVRIDRWYDLDARAARQEVPRSLPEAAGRLRELLESSVRLRLRSDVPIGLLLSGGVDSSGIAGLIGGLEHAARGNYSGRTISTRYPGRPEIDETFLIDEVLRATRFSGDFVVPTVEGFDRELDDYVFFADTLVPRSVFYAEWLLFRRARELGLPVMISGQGSDELFGGYEPWEVHTRQLWNRGRRLEALREGFLSSRRQWGLVRGTRHTLGMIRTPNASMACGCGPGGSIQEHQRHLLLVDYLPVLLELEDRDSMAWGVEARLPFLDFRIVEFARALPGDYLLRDGWTKVVLREALRGIAPAAVLERPTKLGLPGPIEGSAGRDRAAISRSIGRLAETGWLEALTAEQLREPGTDQGFRLRVLDAWRRRCLGGD